MLNFFEIVLLIILGVFLSLFCYFIVEYTQRQPAQRVEHGLSHPQRETDEKRIERIDHLFDVGLVLVTILSAAELQYVSVKTELQEAATRNMADVNFAFRILTIPIVVLILSWLIKELINNTRLRILIRNFCWGLFTMILSLEGLLFVVLATYTTLSQLQSIFGVLLFFSFILTFAIIWTYRELGSESVHFPSRFRSFLWAVVESISYVSFSYFILIAVFFFGLP